MDPFRTHLSMPGAMGACVVHTVRGREALGEPFRYELVFTAPGLDPEAARAAIAHLVLTDTGGVERHVSGAVEAVELAVFPGREVGGDVLVRAILAPTVPLTLRFRRNCRIFQELDVKGVVEAVLAAAELDAALLDWGGLQSTYPVREYCVQYEETDWDFIQRLLEEEGIYYAFDHAADGHTMLLLDDVVAAPALEPSGLDFTAQPKLAQGVHRVWSWWSRGRVSASKATLRDYDMTRPSLDLEATAEAEGLFEREHYEYPGRYREPDVGAQRARRRLEEVRSKRRTSEAVTDVLATLPGRRFELLGHPDAGGEHLVVRSELSVRIRDDFALPPGFEESGFEESGFEESGFDRHEAVRDARLSRSPNAGDDAHAQVAFACVPTDQPFRPARRTPRPSLPALQTATVTGPSGEEIHCDEHGRVKVQFHWDRLGQLDDHSSCWIRVTQAHTTGSVMIPRIGWEVLVGFVDGDPDRPLVLGKLWNPNHPPPVELPAQKTRTGHSSISSPGGGGFNEMVFDDAAGAETFTINAHHDFNVVAANNRTENVGRNRSTTVNGQRTSQVGGDETITVGANRNTSVGADHSLTVGANRTVTVSGAASEEIAGDFSLTAGMEMVMVGNAMAAILEVVAAETIQAASGAAAQAANRATAALLGPIEPALQTAREALGPAAQLAGPAAALLGDGDPQVAAFAQAAGAISAVPGAADAAGVAATVAHSAVSGNLAAAAASTIRGRGSDASSPEEGGAGGGGGSGGGDDDEAPEEAASASSGGNGAWGWTVDGPLTETVGGAMLINSAAGISFSIGGECREQVGAARMEMVRGGGKAETTGGNKLETVGVYMIKAGESFGIDAKATALNIAGSQKQKISGGHSISAEGAVAVNAPRVNLKGSGTITLKCGSCELVIKSGGIMIEGASSVTLEASGAIEIDENALGS